MPILDVFASALSATSAVAASGTAKSKEPERFLQVAAAIAELSRSPVSLIPSALPESQSPSRLLDAHVCRKHLDVLHVRGIELQPNSAIVGAEGAEGTVVLFSRAGGIRFKGPLNATASAKGFVWNGVAETIEITPDGDVMFVNQQGVFGKVKDNASTRVMLCLENLVEMVFRSMDPDPQTKKLRALAGRYIVQHAARAFDAMPPCEIRIGMDAVYGIRMTELYSTPTTVIISKKLHQNVVQIQNSPTVGITRVETMLPNSDKIQSYCIAPQIMSV